MTYPYSIPFWDPVFMAKSTWISRISQFMTWHVWLTKAHISMKYPQSKKYIWNPNHCGYLPFFPHFPNKHMVTSQTYIMSKSTHPKNTQQIMNSLAFLSSIPLLLPFFPDFSRLPRDLRHHRSPSTPCLRRCGRWGVRSAAPARRGRGECSRRAAPRQPGRALLCHHDPPWKMGWKILTGNHRFSHDHGMFL